MSPTVTEHCEWSAAHLPGVVPDDVDFFGWAHFRKVVHIPEACRHTSCALLLGEVAQAARLNLGGRALGSGGVMPPARAPNRIYPLAFTIPAESVDDRDSVLTVTVTGPKRKHAGVTKGPLAILFAPDAQTFVKAHNVGTVFVPLAVALGLILVAGALALYAFVCPPKDMLLLFAVGTYCIVNTFFLVSFADQNYAWVPMDLAAPLRYSARRLNDVALVSILYLWLGFRGLSRVVFRTTFFFVVGISTVGVSYVWIHRLAGADPLPVVSAISTVTTYTWGVKFLGPVGASLSAVLDWRQPRRRIECFALLSLVGVFAHDSAIFWGSALGDYASRFHVLVLACLFSGLVIRRATERATRQQLQAESEAELGRAARQVAHDIRSPLAALNHLLRFAEGMDESHRVLLRSASGRINDIANLLLFRGRESESRSAQEQTSLLQSLEIIVTELRMRYRSRLSISIDLQTDGKVHLAFVQVSATELQRSVANLVNNAVEAIGEKAGSVTVSAQVVDENRVDLWVSDTGPGIPEQIRSKLGRSGATFNKKGGSGLGLFQAKMLAENAEGTFVLDSRVGQGTCVKMTFPTSAAPPWFATKITVGQHQNIVILDDDDSIHLIWRSRLNNLCPLRHAGLQSHMSTPTELRCHIEKHEPGTKALYLIDYELLGFSETGIELITQLGLEASAILVTSRADELDVQQQCLRHKIKMLPKSLAGHMPIVVTVAESAQEAKNVGRVHAVVIDDDPLIHHIWSMAAKQRGHHYLHVNNLDAAHDVLGEIDKMTPIFVDYNLGSTHRGDVMSKRFVDAGYHKVFLMTGEDEYNLPAMPWLAGVTGKDPPSNL